MDNIMNEMDFSFKSIKEGEIIKGKVIAVNDKEVFVNIGYISDGVVPKNELFYETDKNPKDYFKEGDELFVYVEKLNDGEGNVLLSKIKADKEVVWDELNELMDKGTYITINVKEAVKSGVVAMFKGVRGFIPASQLSLKYTEDLKEFIGKDLSVIIIEVNAENNKLVMSHKQVLLKEKEKNKIRVWESLKKGEKREGVVTRLTNFGAFVDIGWLEGLVHVSDLSWERVTDPSKVVKVGDKVFVYVIDFDKDKNRISLDMKDNDLNPWKNIHEKYFIGQKLQGRVSKVLDFGAIVEIDPGVEGLVHISEISEDRVSKVSSVLKVGDEVKVSILSIDEKEKRISLSIKAAKETIVEDYKKYNDNEENITLGDLFKDKLKNLK